MIEDSAILACRDVCRIYGDNYALVDVTTQLRPGRIKALLGPNGAGKSTLLGLCSSRVAPSEGTIEFDGVPLNKCHSLFRKNLGLVSHQVMLYGALTGLENLRFFSSIAGGPSDRDTIDAALDRVGLAWAKNRRVDEYSRGMQQRLTVARALIHQPRLLLMDEPFTGLDQVGVEVVCRLIREAKSRGASILMSSHDLPTLSGLVDEVLILKQGRVRFDGDSTGDVGLMYQQAISGSL